MVFDPPNNCFPGSVTLASSLHLVVGREFLTAAGRQRPDPHPSDCGDPSFPGRLSLRCPTQRSGPYEVRGGKSPYAILGRRTEGPGVGRWIRTRGAGVPRCTGQALHVKACTPSLAFPLLPRLRAVPCTLNAHPQPQAEQALCQEKGASPPRNPL